MLTIDIYNTDPHKVTDKFLETVWGLAKKAVHSQRDYLRSQELAFRLRQTQRKDAGKVVVAWLGWGRAGKDEAGLWLGGNSELVYPGGGCSLVAKPLIAAALGMSEEQCYAERHQSRLFWYHFLNAVRDIVRPTILTEMVLARGDMVTGIRSAPELQVAVADGFVDKTVWVHRPDNPADPTVEYDELDCEHVIINPGDNIPDYYAKLRRLCGDRFGISLKEHPTNG